MTVLVINHENSDSTTKYKLLQESRRREMFLFKLSFQNTIC